MRVVALRYAPLVKKKRKEEDRAPEEERKKSGPQNEQNRTMK